MVPGRALDSDDYWMRVTLNEDDYLSHSDLFSIKKSIPLLSPAHQWGAPKP